jgi:putative flippase GtrA
MTARSRLAADLIVLDEIARFLAVGFAGFVLNVIILWVLHSHLGMNLTLAEIVGAVAAIQLSFVLHNNWTYRTFHQQAVLPRLITFNIVASFGAALNLVILLWLVDAYQMQYLWALAIGGAVSLIWNFLLNRLVIWRHPKSK